MDVVDERTRSRMMSAIRGKDTRPEMIVRRFLHAAGFRYRLHDRRLPGRPDLVLKRYSLAIQVHGCFWHRHEACPYATVPSTNPQRWAEKFRTNKLRDHANEEKLLAMGWRILILWECGLRGSNFDLDWLPAWIDSAERRREWPCLRGIDLPGSD